MAKRKSGEAKTDQTAKLTSNALKTAGAGFRPNELLEIEEAYKQDGNGVSKTRFIAELALKAARAKASIQTINSATTLANGEEYSSAEVLAGLKKLSLQIEAIERRQLQTELLFSEFQQTTAAIADYVSQTDQDNSNQIGAIATKQESMAARLESITKLLFVIRDQLGIARPGERRKEITP